MRAMNPSEVSAMISFCLGLLSAVGPPRMRRARSFGSAFMR